MAAWTRPQRPLHRKRTNEIMAEGSRVCVCARARVCVRVSTCAGVSLCGMSVFVCTFVMSTGVCMHTLQLCCEIGCEV